MNSEKNECMCQTVPEAKILFRFEFKAYNPKKYHPKTVLGQ